MRFRSRGRIRDRSSEAARHPRATPRTYAWGGYACGHYGHFVAEHSTRLLTSMRARPADKVLFVLGPRRAPATVKPFFRNVTGWLGVPRKAVVFVRRTLLIERLVAMPQAESLPAAGPSVAYLDLLDENARRNGVMPIRNPTVYVTRAGLISRGRGAHLGEAHHAGALRGLGVVILDPASTPLLEQLSLYAGAPNLVFAEGSAMHGRQLLGRIDRHIVVLGRRTASRMAEAALRPRCTTLTFVEAAEGEWVPYDPQIARFVRAHAVTRIDLSRTFEAFAAIGIDLEGAWNQQAFERALAEDRARFRAIHPDRREGGTPM